MGETNKTAKIHWHPGFYGGIELELREYRELLEFETEHSLSKEPLRMDMLIIKKTRGVRIGHPIAEMFRQYNVVEYKSPEDALTIDDFYKVIGYACLYKGMGKTVGEIREEELTVSIFRHAKPRELFKALQACGAEIRKTHEGIYRVRGVINLPTQVVVMKELERGAHPALKVLTRGAEESEVRCFIGEAEKYILPVDRQNADAVLQVSIRSNRELYGKVREGGVMCEALEELMKDKLDEREARGEAKGEARGVVMGADRVKDAVLAIKDGTKPAEVRKRYGKDVYESARSIIKALA